MRGADNFLDLAVARMQRMQRRKGEMVEMVATAVYLGSLRARKTGAGKIGISCDPSVVN